MKYFHLRGKICNNVSKPQFLSGCTIAQKGKKFVAGFTNLNQELLLLQ